MKKETNDLISVIVPVYKVEQYLRRCVDSIVNQTYKNLEIILVDDGSPDNCGKICDEYAAKDDRIVVVHKKNGGLSDARNAGIEIARGEFLGFVDSDDYIAPDMYEILVSDIRKSGASISMCAITTIYGVDNIQNNDRHGEYEYIVTSAQDALEVCLKSRINTVNAVNKLYKRHLFDEVRYPKRKTSEDAFVIADILKNVTSASINQMPLYYYVRRPDSITTSSYKMSDLDIISAYEHVLERVRESFPALEDLAKARLLWAHLIVLDKSIMMDQPDLNYKIQKYIRQNIKYLNNGLFTSKRKMMAMVACVNLGLYRWLIRKYGK